MGAFVRVAAALACCTLASGVVFAQSKTVVVIASAPIRIMPDTRRVPLTTLRPGDTVRLEEHEGDWYRVSFRDMRWGWRVGYVQAAHVDVGKSRAEPSAVPQSAEIDRSVVEPAVLTAAASVGSASAPVRVTERPEAASRDRGLGKRAIGESIAIGRRQYARTQGLRLDDSGRQFPAAFGGVDHTGRTASTGLRLQVFTPLAWIRQLAGEAKTENRKLVLDQLPDDATEPVLRVFAYLSVPSTGARSEMPGTAAVQHLVLRDPNTGTVLESTFEQPFRRDAGKATGGRAAFEGVLVKFPMDAIREFRRATRNGEFVISVIGSTRETRDFRVEKKDFDKLPGAR